MESSPSPLMRQFALAACTSAPPEMRGRVTGSCRYVICVPTCSCSVGNRDLEIAAWVDMRQTTLRVVSRHIVREFRGGSILRIVKAAVMCVTTTNDTRPKRREYSRSASFFSLLRCGHLLLRWLCWSSILITSLFYFALNALPSVGSLLRELLGLSRHRRDERESFEFQYVPRCACSLKTTPQNFECTSLFESEFSETPACGKTGVPSHVFRPEENDMTRFEQATTTPAYC